MYLVRWWDVARLRLRTLLRHGRVEQDLEKELRFHLESEAEENIGRGLQPSEAHIAALRRLGGVAQIQEECRDMRRTNLLENLFRDLQYAVRTLARTPGFAVVIVLTLALSIGANSAIFSVINGVLLRPLPYPQGDRIVRIFFSNPTFPRFPLNPLDFRDIRGRNRAFEWMAGITRKDRQLSGIGQPERLSGFAVTAGYFHVLGIPPALGRDFTSDDELPGRGNLVIVSDHIWRSHFAGDRHIIGRKITLDDIPYTVTAVMPPGVEHPGNDYHGVRDGETVDVWTPFIYDPENTSRGSHYLEGIARLKNGTTLAQAQNEMRMQVAELGREHPDSVRGWQPLVIPLYTVLVGSSRRLLLILLGAVGLVLLIACANATNLLLARATSRKREIAVRAAIGASRSRLVCQMLAESLLISIAGGGLGAVIALGGVKALTSLLPADFPRASAIHVDPTVFAFTLAIALATGILFGLAPAAQAARADLQQTLREGGRGATTGGRHLSLRNTLVVVEVSLACVLLIGAGLMLRSFVNLLRSDPGFRPERVITASLSLPEAQYPKRADLIQFYDRLGGRLKQISGIHFAGLASDLPWTGWNDNIGGFLIDGQPSANNNQHHTRYHLASEDFFQAMGTPLLHGRFFTPHDEKGAPAVILINRQMARMYWGKEDVVGARITFSDRPAEKDWMTVVGVVGDVADRPGQVPEPGLWWPVLQQPFGFSDMSLAVSANGDAATLAAQIREAVRSLDPSLAVANMRQMDEIASDMFSTARFALFLVALFAVLAVTLAAIGIYGVISYSVGQRTQEFGLRMALGARPGDVVLQVVTQGVKLALGGIVLGLLAALALGRLVWSLLYGVSASDPSTFGAVAVIAVIVALVACYIPARRATRADPANALRAQ